MLLKIDAKMLLTHMARDNIGCKLEDGNPMLTFLFSEQWCHRFSSTLGETVEKIPQDWPPLASIWIYFGRKIAGTRHLNSQFRNGVKNSRIGFTGMSAEDLYKYLEANGIDELGVLDPLDTGSDIIQQSMLWVQRIVPTNPKTFWFCPSTSSVPKPGASLLSRWIPMAPEKHEAWLQSGPFPAILVQREGIPFPERHIIWREPYAKYGAMVEAGEFAGWTLWTWKPLLPPRRALLFCHHCAVLPDVQRQIRILGIRGDFVWISDEKPPMGDAWPSFIEGLKDSIPMRHEPVETAIPEAFIERVKATYSMIFTSHCMRYPLLFERTGLPVYHINSTRFGNELTVSPPLFQDLCVRILKAVTTGWLKVIHNNHAEKWYAGQYLGEYMEKAPVIQSLCDSPLRFRITVPPAVGKPFLIWDTRFHIADGKGSKTLLEIHERLGTVCDVTSVLTRKSKSYLDDNMLSEYQAIIHVPYNISTMSCFEQSAAGIPIWVPSPEYLEKILLDPEEHSELSWFCYSEDRKGFAMPPDQVWKRECLREFVKRADFYNGTLNCVFTFDSVDDLATRISTESYTKAVQSSFVLQGRKRLRALEQYADILKV